MIPSSYLPRVCRQAMSQFCGDLASFGEDFGGERGQLVPVLIVACERKHFRAQAHELDAVLIVPLQHLDNVPGICKAEILDVLLTQSDVRFLVLVWSVLCGMLGL